MTDSTMMMRCRICGRTDSLETLPCEEDGFASEYPIDICIYCVEVTEERREEREEWDHYHPDEPCPEID